METFPLYWPFVQGIQWSPMNSHHKCQWREALMFSFICAWTKIWANNGGADDLRCLRTHYDIIVMHLIIPSDFVKACVDRASSFCSARYVYVILKNKRIKRQNMYILFPRFPVGSELLSLSNHAYFTLSITARPVLKVTISSFSCSLWFCL